MQMVDLKSQYLAIKTDIDNALNEVLDSTTFINGPQVKTFQNNLEKYLDVKHVIPCANGTDALQIAMMVLDLEEGDEIILPAFNYIATAEVAALLKLKPVMVDVDAHYFNIAIEKIEAAITTKTKAIVPVHLFGQGANMEGIMNIASKYNLFVIEDNAQALGAHYFFKDGSQKKLGCIGHIGTTSFFPSKNLGCYGDGGAIMTNDDNLAHRMKMIANHGQTKKYVHDTLGCNSRLDTIQAAILNVKLPYLDQYRDARSKVAQKYDESFAEIVGIEIPNRVPFSNHVFHQYTIRVKDGKRDGLKKYLEDKKIPSMIYYPLPLYRQKVFSNFILNETFLPNTENLCEEVLSLPIHTEMRDEDLTYIIRNVVSFFHS